MEPPRAADGQREALMGTPRGPGAVLPAPSAPSGPHIPEAGLGSTLDRGVGAGGGAVRSLEPGRGASRSRRSVPDKDRGQGHKSLTASGLLAGVAVSLT